MNAFCSRKNACVLLILSVSLGFCDVRRVAAQDAHTSHQPPALPLAIPRELLERPLPLRKGIGSAHDAVSTRLPQAQAFYDQGLTYLHSFVWIEAA